MSTKYNLKFQDGKTASLQYINDRFSLAQPALTDEAHAALCLFLMPQEQPTTQPLKRGDEVKFIEGKQLAQPDQQPTEEPKPTPLKREQLVTFGDQKGVVVASGSDLTGVMIFGASNITMLHTQDLIATDKTVRVSFLPGDPVMSISDHPARIFRFVGYSKTFMTDWNHVLDNGHKLVAVHQSHTRPAFTEHLVDVVEVKGTPRPELRTKLVGEWPTYMVKSGDSAFAVDRADFYLTHVPATDYKKHAPQDIVIVPALKGLELGKVVKQESHVVTVALDSDPDSPLYYTADCPIKVLPEVQRIKASASVDEGSYVRVVVAYSSLKLGDQYKVTKHHGGHVELSNGMVVPHSTVQPA